MDSTVDTYTHTHTEYRQCVINKSEKKSRKKKNMYIEYSNSMVFIFA